MESKKEANYNINTIWNKLMKGVSLDNIVIFYGVSRQKIMNDLISYHGVNSEQEVLNILRSKRRGTTFNKASNSNIIIDAAKYYKKEGLTYQEFLSLLKASKRTFSEEAIIAAKNIFDEHDEIEI